MPRVAAHMWLRLLLFAAGYALLATLGAAMLAQFGYVPVFWPAAGLSVAVLLRAPLREWPAYLAVIAAVDIALTLHMDGHLGLAAGMAVADTTEPVVGALLLRRLLRPGEHDGPHVALRFLLACV